MSKIITRTVFVACLALVIGVKSASAITLGQVAQVARSAEPAAFNTIEIAAPSSAEAHVQQWNRVKSGLESDTRQMSACLQAAEACQTSALKAWRVMMIEARNATSESMRLNLVNRYFNQWSYISDSENYNTSEYWASPMEFMAKGGDCEDYAIAKYASLQLLGYTDRHMRIMAVVDNSRGGMGHAVLSVSTMTGSQILDNRSTVVYDGALQTAYAPRFAVNQSGVYTYAVQPRVIMANAY